MNHCWRKYRIYPWIQKPLFHIYSESIMEENWRNIVDGTCDGC